MIRATYTVTHQRGPETARLVFEARGKVSLYRKIAAQMLRLAQEWDVDVQSLQYSATFEGVPDAPLKPNRERITLA